MIDSPFEFFTTILKITFRLAVYQTTTCNVLCSDSTERSCYLRYLIKFADRILCRNYSISQAEP